jgi:opacity protein-like surface antigen
MLNHKTFALLLLGSTALLPGASFAADMPDFVEPAAVEVKQFGGWYLRGDVGITNQRVDEFTSPIFDTGDFTVTESDFDASAFLGFGFGYRINKQFRVDVTGEYRFESEFNGLDNYADEDLPGGLGINDYDGNKTEWVALVNGYWDLPSYGIMTPFIGAGVGAARVEINDFSDFNPAVPGTALGLSGDTDTWNFAWALYAGLAFEVSPQWTFEVAYRYLNLGDAETEDLVTPDGANPTFNPYSFNDLTSHDVKMAVRYNFN